MAGRFTRTPLAAKCTGQNTIAALSNGRSYKILNTAISDQVVNAYKPATNNAHRIDTKKNVVMRLRRSRKGAIVTSLVWWDHQILDENKNHSASWTGVLQ